MSCTMGVISPSTEQPARGRQSYVDPAALLGAGLLLAVSTNLAKVAQGIGVTPLAYLTCRTPIALGRQSLPYAALASGGNCPVSGPRHALGCDCRSRVV